MSTNEIVPLFEVEISYSHREQLQELSPETYAHLAKTYSNFKLPENQADLKSWWGSSGGALTLFDIRYLASIGLKFQVSSFSGLTRVSELLRFARSVGVHTTEHNAPIPEIAQQPATQITIPNVGLFSVQSVEVLEDCCTDELQRLLNLGWRIVAVCPPNDTRRPTYIIGHMDRGVRA